MAQHPKKLQWKEQQPHGLSASQFGMALGFCGRIVDYVDYLRNIVGSELEFTGNIITSHGIATEPKARALYELLTGSAVSDGGFFLTDDKLLGCSPDGLIFYDVHVPCSTECAASTSSSKLTSPPGIVSVRIPFRSKWRPQSDLTSASSATGSLLQKCRLLEIKSPYYSLYDGSKPMYQPFGIPLQYLCQMQGQMAIANMDECDFFVYVDRPVCQVAAWRVRRSSEFWDWASPKLRQVVEWVKDGPPAWLTRRFEFEAFDFTKIIVEPLIFPYDITANMPIFDSRRFSFFERFPSPYREVAGVAHQDGILRGLTSAVTRFIFHTDVDQRLEEKEGGHDNDDDDVLWCSLEGVASCWNSLLKMKDVDICEVLALVRPRDFNDNKVTCRIHRAVCNMGRSSYNNDISNTLRVSYFQRDFFHSLEPLISPLIQDRDKTLTAATDSVDMPLSTAGSEGATQLSKSALLGRTSSPSKGRETSVHSTESVVIIDETVSLSHIESVVFYQLSQ